MNRIPRHVLLGLLVAAAFAVLAGCGNKGPLYLPPPEPIDPTTVPADQPPAKEDSAEPAEPSQPAEDAGTPADTNEDTPAPTPAPTPEETPASDGNG